jgi:hypothetical protein
VRRTKRKYRTPAELATFREPFGLPKKQTVIRIPEDVFNLGLTYKKQHKIELGRIVTEAMRMYCGKYPPDTVNNSPKKS